MTRPLHVASLALAASLAFLPPGIQSAQAGGGLAWPPGQIGNGHFANGGAGWSAPRVALPVAPNFSAARLSAPSHGLRHSHQSNYAYAVRAIANGDFPLGFYYDAVLARAYGGGQGGYVQTGPTIITLGAVPASQTADPLVIPAPYDADLARTHGVRVVYLTDPPAEFQLQAGTPAKSRKAKVPEMAPIKPKY